MTANTTNIIYPDLSYKIMGAIFEVHQQLGPGFLESIDEKALMEGLLSRGIKVQAQKVIDLTYKNKKIGIHRLDLIVEDKEDKVVVGRFVLDRDFGEKPTYL